MKKAICSKCKSLILIDESSPQTECPNCKEQLLTDSCIKSYMTAIAVFKRKGDLAMYNRTDYLKAYDNYIALLKLNENDLTTLLSATVARLYCSTLHELYIKEATDVLLKGSDNVEISSENIKSLADFLNKMRLDVIKIVDAYKERSLESQYALNNYLNCLKEYKYFINAYIDIYDSLDKLNQFMVDSKEVLLDTIKEIDNLLKSRYVVKSSETKKHAYLDKKGKEVIAIYPSRKKIFITRVLLYVLTGIGAILSLIGLIFVSTGNNDKIASSIVLGIGLVFFVGGYFVNHYIGEKYKKKQLN